MIMRNSLLQLKRTPIKTALFTILIAGTTALLVIGSILWLYASESLKAYSDSFSTIATVEQEQLATEKMEIWDAEQQDYSVYTRPTFSDIIDTSVLDIPDVEYIDQAEKRPYYGAYCPQYKLYENDTLKYMFLVVEVSPVEDCVPDHPVKMTVKNVRYGAVQEGIDIWFCDHQNPNPNKLYAENTYIMSLVERPPHEEYREYEYEYMPVSIESTQCSVTGESLVENDSSYYYDLITDDFTNTATGKKWESVIEAIEKLTYTLPVQPVENTDLLLPFYRGSSYISDGRYITKEEYDKGQRVCMVPQDFAKRNQVKVGDQITLPLYYADYQNGPGTVFNTGGWSFRFGIVNARNEAYPVFSENSYEVVGIYTATTDVELGRAYQVGVNEIIIPAKSVKESDENNIVAYGPMRGYNTTFQIPNGTIEEFMEVWERQGVTGLKFQFYDNGYTELEQGINNMRNMSILLLFLGLIVSFLVLLFFAHLFIMKQRKRMAIERALGMTQKQSERSLISGMLVMIAAGVILGSIFGTSLSGYAIEKSSAERVYYDDTYSNGKKAESNKNVDVELEIWEKAVILLMNGLIVIMMSSAIIFCYRRNIRKTRIIYFLMDKDE